MSFSIAMPVYGQQQFIITALNSIRAQSVHFELAVMDATPDSSVQKILDDYEDIISYRRHGEDDGQSAAIDEGWKNSSGEYVAWLCADDYYFPDTLQAVQEVFEQHPEIDIVYGDSIYVDADDCFKMYFPSIENDVSCLPVHDCIAQPSFFMRRSALEKTGGLNLQLHYIMDWDLWSRLYKNGAKFYYLHQPLSVTRVYPETKTSGMSFSRYREINQNLKLQSSLFHRVRTLLGMLHYDLSENKRNIPMHCIFLLLNLYLTVKKVFVPNYLGSLYGLEKRTNKITRTAIISFPWYDHEPPQMVTLETSPNVEVSLCVNGEPVRCGPDTEDEIQVFYLSKKLAVENKSIWKFELRVDHPCCLRLFEIT